MIYMGSKNRISKYIVPIIQEYIDSNNVMKYIEPFVGGANIIDKIHCDKRCGCDANKYLIALLKRVQSGGSLYDEVPKTLYDKVRSAFNSGDTSEFEDWQVGNVGFIASFNGRWFDGGYAKSGYSKIKNGLRFRNYYQEAKNNILQQAPYLCGIDFYSSDYRQIKNICELKNCVIYCDPPYQGTKQYANAKRFDYDEFWNVIREWSKNNIVIISEQEAPSDFDCIWELEVKRTLSHDKSVKATEKLFRIRE